MKIYSRPLISELKTFVALGGSYAAKVGENDDLVMASLLIVRMLQQLQEFHQDIEGHMRDHEEFVQPLPFFAVIS
jgi:cell division protein ZapA (FtsZ GTPase activity inhibitor)